MQKNQINKGRELMKAFEIKRAIFKLRQRTLQTAKLNSKFRALELKRN